MAAEFVDAMLYANLALSAAILFVMVVRALVKRLFGARVAYGLWLAVPLAGAVSFLPAPVMHVPTIATASTGMPILLPMPLSTSTTASDPIAAAVPAFEYGAALLLAIWLFGLLASAGILALRQKRFVDGLGHLRPRAGEGAPLYVCASSNKGPAVVGMFAPRIILPADFESRYNADEQLVVLAHERAHLERGDALLNGLVALLRCLCWFNPLVHVAALYQRRDQEMACDATVVARHADKRRAYANALLKAQLAQDALPLGCHWPALSAHPLKARVASLDGPDRTPAIRWAGFAAISISSFCIGYAAWAAQPPTVVYEVVERTRVQPSHKIFVPFIGTAKSQGRAQISQESVMTKQMSPAAMVGRVSATLLLGAVPAMSTEGTALLVTPAVAQPAPSHRSRPDPWVGTPGRAEEQAGLRIWNQAGGPCMGPKAECDAKIASWFEANPDKAAEREAYYAQAVKLASAAAKKGDARAMYLLAALYGNGWGVEQSEAMKLDLTRQGAEAGDTRPMGDWTASGQAMASLAYLYDIGILSGISRDPDEAAKWYRRWAETVRPGTAAALEVPRILARLDTAEYRVSFFPAPNMPTLMGR